MYTRYHRHNLQGFLLGKTQPDTVRPACKRCHRSRAFHLEPLGGRIASHPSYPRYTRYCHHKLALASPWESASLYVSGSVSVEVGEVRSGSARRPQSPCLDCSSDRLPRLYLSESLQPLPKSLC
jgi:hypothetical protein